MPITLSSINHVAAFLAYGALAIFLALAPARSWLKALMFFGAAFTAAWALTVPLGEQAILPSWVVNISGVLRDAGWYAVVLAILYAQVQSHRLWWVLLATTSLILFVHALFVGFNLDAGRILGVPVNASVTGIVEAIIGLILIENMMRNLAQDQFWAVKHLGIGLFAVLVFQLLVRVPEFLTGMQLESLNSIRPLVFLIALPLFAVTATRSPGLHLKLHSSRRIVFHAATLIAAGVVLQGAAVASYYLRQIGGDSGTALSITLGFVTLVGVGVGLVSASTRSRLRAIINENFFPYKYDYRLEWDKFIRALSARDEGDMPLRVLRTLAELLDSTGGILWVLRDRWVQFMPVASWSTRIDLAPLAVDDPCLKGFGDEDCAYIDLKGSTKNPTADLWAQRFPGSWLAVPLRYRTKLIGVALLNPPRAARRLDWEDKNLVSLVALQLAAYMIQEETAQALADARQLEEFNNRFAFILHDTKNTIGQLSLLVRNVEEFGHNEEFRKDMTATLRHAVEKLQALLGQLRGDNLAKKPETVLTQEVDVNGLVGSFVQDRRKMGLNIVMQESATPALVTLADKDVFLGVLDLVVGNAVEAAPEGSPVSVRVGNSENSACVTVTDQGPGMTQEFIAGQLFRPLRSTKGNGFGIGAYQAREVMKDLGGTIDVQSQVGEGTTVFLRLPTKAAQQKMRA